MNNFKTENDKILFALDFANFDLESKDLRLGDVMNLRDGFLESGLPVLSDEDYEQGIRPSNSLVFQVKDEKSLQHLKEVLKQIQSKLRGYLDSLSGENFVEQVNPKKLAYYMDILNPRGVTFYEGTRERIMTTVPIEARAFGEATFDWVKVTKLVLNLNGTGVSGTPADMFIFHLMLLLFKVGGGIYKCPQCTRYFLKRGIKRFCTPRCQVNWANRKYYRSKQAKDNVIDLYQEKRLSAKEIVARLRHKYDLSENDVRSWIGKRSPRRKGTSKRRK